MTNTFYERRILTKYEKNDEQENYERKTVISSKTKEDTFNYKGDFASYRVILCKIGSNNNIHVKLNIESEIEKKYLYHLNNKNF